MLYVLALVAIVVGVDILPRHQFWPRLAVNVGIGAVFAACYHLPEAPEGIGGDCADLCAILGNYT